MDNRHCRIGALFFLHQQSGKRLADDVAASQDHDMFSFDWHAVGLQQVLDAERGAGDEPILFAEKQFAGIEGMEAIHIFFWADAGEDRPFREVGGKGKLDEDAVNQFIAIEGIDLRLEFGAGDGRWKPHNRRLHTDLLAGALFRSHVGVRGWVIADKKEGKTWASLMALDRLADLLLN